MYPTVLVAALLTLSCFDVAISLPNGAPAGACDSMSPNHDAVGQNISAPYTLTLSKNTYKCGDEITVTLAATGGSNFKGFLCQARPDPADAATSGSLSGDTSMTTNKCDGKASLTHSSRDPKTSMALKWKANNNDTSVTFVCTVVQEKVTFWVKGVTASVTFAGAEKCPSGEGVKLGVNIPILMFVICSMYFLM